MIKVFPLRDVHLDEFRNAFRAYYTELGCDEDCDGIVDDYIVPDVLSGTLKVDLIHDEGKFAGFSIYQIDELTSDMCVREGAGDLREIFIIPPLRRRGLGRFLLYSAEMKLSESGAKGGVCVPCESAAGFFTACGYSKTAQYIDDLDGYVYEKPDFNVGKCKK